MSLARTPAARAAAAAWTRKTNTMISATTRYSSSEDRAFDVETGKNVYEAGVLVNRDAFAAGNFQNPLRHRTLAAREEARCAIDTSVVSEGRRTFASSRSGHTRAAR